MDRELDVKVAEAMGYFVKIFNDVFLYATNEETYHKYLKENRLGADDLGGSFAFCRRLPFYSTDIAAAWQVVEWMTSRGWLAELECLPLVPSPMWFVHFNYYRDGQANRKKGYGEGGVCAQTICRAFLEAMRDKRIRSRRLTVPAPPPAPRRLCSAEGSEGRKLP